MSAACLPPETLQEIFKNLCAIEVLKCRLVCKSWKAAVDGFSDTQWNRIIEKEYRYSVYKKVHDKASIPWRDTFIALNSWGNIKSAKVECSQLPALDVKLFKMLPNRVIAILTTNPGSGDTIVYYDIDTLKELGRKTYEKKIRDFDENEHLIVLLCNDDELILVQKANDKQEAVGKLHQHDGQFGLFGKKVYFQKKDGLIYLSKLKETKKGELFIRTAPLKAFEENYDSFEEHVVSFGYMDNKLTILSDEGNVYEYADQDFGLLNKFRWHSGDIIEDLNEYGFDWTSPRVYPWLFCRYKNNIEIVKTKHQCLIMHGPVVVLGTYNKRLVHIFSLEREFNENAKPVRTIDMNKFANISKGKDAINQIDIVESISHHRIIVLTSRRVFVLKFEFDAILSEEPKAKQPTKRSATFKNTQPKSKAKKILKKPSVPQKSRSPKHRYNTRNAQNRKTSTAGQRPPPRISTTIGPAPPASKRLSRLSPGRRSTEWEACLHYVFQCVVATRELYCSKIDPNYMTPLY